MINSVHDLDVGDLYTTDGKDVWEVKTFIDRPSVTLQNVRTGEERGGAVGCRLLADFIRLRPWIPGPTPLTPVGTEARPYQTIPCYDGINYGGKANG
ncbi:MAG: hypothetical protein K9N51_02330 [Candidatus Pacebacteria bacterium]|nr:hypothetical protein [Candidatus Paceibacterota bacterium]